jgi:hypothetical protein
MMMVDTALPDGIVHMIRGHYGSIDTAGRNYRFAGSKRNQAQPRLRYRSRRALTETVVEYGKEKDRFGLISKRGGYHDGGSHEREKEYSIPAPRHTKSPEDMEKGSSDNVVMFKEEVEVKVIDG